MKRIVLISIMSVVVATASIGGGILWQRRLSTSSTKFTNHDNESHQMQMSSYQFDLKSGTAYQPNKPNTLEIALLGSNGQPLLELDTVHEKKLHLIVIRKDRNEFQHVHPILNTDTGIFRLENFVFPSDGPYRMFADFTVSNEAVDGSGYKKPTTLTKDITAGDMSKYKSNMASQQKLVSKQDAYSAEFFVSTHDGGEVGNNFNAGTTSTLAIAINKDSEAYTQLQPYLGALGHLVVISPNLEYIHAHPKTESDAVQTGLVTFEVPFPRDELYSLFLEIKAEDKIKTFDFALKVQPGVKNSDNTSAPGHGSSH